MGQSDLLRRGGLAGVLIGSLMVAPLAAEEWRLPTLLPEGSVQVQSLELFSHDLQAATGGRIAPSVYPADSLTLQANLVRAVQSGEVKMAALPLEAMANWGPLFEADSLPTLASDYASARKLWAVLRGPLQKELWSRDLILLFAAPQPPRGLLGPKGLTGRAGLAGQRLGGSNSLSDPLARSLGAIPVVEAPPRLAEAFRTGSINAAFLGAPEALRGATGATSAAFYPLDSWVPLTVVVMHEPTFETLSRADQEALRQAASAAEAQAWVAGEAQNEAILRLLQRDGLYQVSAGLDQELQEAGRQVAGDWLARAGLPGEALLRAFRN